MGDEWSRSPRGRRFFHWLLDNLFRKVWGLEVEGLEHLPAEGSVIVAAAPHLSYFDVVIAVACGPKRVMRALTKAEAFLIPGLAAFLRTGRSIPVDRKAGAGGLHAAINALKHGDCVGLFPEGTRSKTGEPGRAKAGTGYLASRAGALVVPLRIIGMKDFPFTRLRLRFGPGMRIEDKAADTAACQAFSQAVLDRALSL